ncbi:hypothetical protein BDK92_7143 [Micromonospora pisi]|uniref:Uncharacterized protein n=1 Tax=Micromonospora pisi TaxID=589240 RepID=A0A495JUH7_9ACTN|nr:hypothetical protein [Micromonospora pisi]RKR92667.1 hypothetical protein BDK92_7143 [Micromonospora pisi]
MSYLPLRDRFGFDEPTTALIEAYGEQLETEALPPFHADACGCQEGNTDPAKCITATGAGLARIFVEEVLGALIHGRVLPVDALNATVPAGLDARPATRYHLHCSHCHQVHRDPDYREPTTWPAEALTKLGDYEIDGWETDVDGRALVCEDCQTGWCEGCGDAVYVWQNPIEDALDVWHPDCADKPCETCNGTGVVDDFDPLVGVDLSWPCRDCKQTGKQVPSGALP